LLVKETKRYIKLKNKFQNDKLLTNKLETTIELFKKDKNDVSLQFKQIICKKDKNRYSIRVIGTKYRILMTVFDEYVELFCVCNHDKYDYYNKAC